MFFPFVHCVWRPACPSTQKRRRLSPNFSLARFLGKCKSSTSPVPFLNVFPGEIPGCPPQTGWYMNWRQLRPPCRLGADVEILGTKKPKHGFLVTKTPSGPAANPRALKLSRSTALLGTALHWSWAGPREGAGGAGLAPARWKLLMSVHASQHFRSCFECPGSPGFRTGVGKDEDEDVFFFQSTLGGPRSEFIRDWSAREGCSIKSKLSNRFSENPKSQLGQRWRVLPFLFLI